MKWFGAGFVLVTLAALSGCATAVPAMSGGSTTPKNRTDVGLGGAARVPLGDLKDPVVNLWIGAWHLLRKMKRAQKFHPRGTPREIFLWTLRFWNGSSKRDVTLLYALDVEKQYKAYKRILREREPMLAQGEEPMSESPDGRL